MSHKFKPGDLALIIAAVTTENIGRIVELVTFHPASEKLVATPDGEFFKNDDGSDAWVIKGDLTVRTLTGKYRSSFAVISPHKLMPLGGDFAPEQAKSSELQA